MDRNLSGYIFIVEEGSKLLPKDITDCSEEQIRDVLDGKDKEFLIGLIIGLCSSLKKIGDLIRKIK